MPYHRGISNLVFYFIFIVVFVPAHILTSVVTDSAWLYMSPCNNVFYSKHAICRKNIEQPNRSLRRLQSLEGNIFLFKTFWYLWFGLFFSYIKMFCTWKSVESLCIFSWNGSFRLCFFTWACKRHHAHKTCSYLMYCVVMFTSRGNVH